MYAKRIIIAKEDAVFNKRLFYKQFISLPKQLSTAVKKSGNPIRKFSTMDII